MKNPKATFIAMLSFTTATYAQMPEGVPKPSEEPIDLTNPADIIIYIILPLFIVVLYLIWRKKRKKENDGH